MASSGKTPNIGLNLWSGNDSPKMADFNADNTILDSVIKTIQDQIAGGGGGGGSSGYELEMGRYTGDGEQAKVIKLGYRPIYGIVFADGTPVCMTVESGKTTQVSVVFCSRYGSSIGCYLREDGIELFQEAEGYGGYRMNMNQRGITYCYLFAKAAGTT